MLYHRRRRPSMRQPFSAPLRSKRHLMLYLYSKVYSYQNFLFFLETGEIADDNTLCVGLNIFVKSVFEARKH